MLGIYGAGGLGTEILDLAYAINKSAPTWDNIVFIADIEGLKNVDGVRVYAFEDFCAVGNEAEVVVALGDPSLRHGLYEKVTRSGLRLATLIHPNAQIGHGTHIGQGCIIQYGAFVSCNVTLGDNVLLQPSCSVGHDSVIGTSCVLSSYVASRGSAGLEAGRTSAPTALCGTALRSDATPLSAWVPLCSATSPMKSSRWEPRTGDAKKYGTSGVHQSERVIA
jgi:acetyltransferase-like isoleucine patch superfamily enzyme